MNKLKKRFPLYSRLLKLYPLPYRRKYETALLQTTADMLDDAPGRAARAAVWTRVAIDLPFSAGRQQLQSAGAAWRGGTPGYVKTNGIAAALLLIPFLLALAANGLDKLVNNRNLYHSWLWHMPFLAVWVLWLPALSFAICAATYSAFVFMPRKDAWYKRLADLRRSWVVIIPGALALAIVFLVFFHDAGRCWSHSPAYIGGHLKQALQCTVPSSKLLHNFLKF